MLKRILACTMLLWCFGNTTPLLAQITGCTPADQTITKGEVFFNYGNAVDAYSTRNRTSYSLGEPIIGGGISKEYNSQIGFWARFLIPPLAPSVTATQGELLDRIQVSWESNPLGSQATDGFKIYRDGVFLASVDRKTRNFNDFNVIAGRPYNYEVRGINFYGEGSPGKALGFQVPNGVVTGWVRTINDGPVPNALVTLTPMQGFSAKFGATDGAIADAAGADTTSLLPTSGDPWTVAFWLKTQSSSGNAGILQLMPFALNVRALNSSGGNEGISMDLGGATLMSAQFPTATKNDWHHVALTFAGGQYRLYVDGLLATLTTDIAIPSATDLNLGSRTGSPGWQGRMDELRIYHLQLDELDLGEVMEGTASSLTPGLQSYWKMDEEQGTKSFDLLKRNKLFFCGAKFDADRPPVRTAGKTNEQGYYRIESASYGTGTTFLAEPMKNFYLHRALKFNRPMSDYATLPDFSLTPKSTLEIWVNSGGPDGTQCLLSKKWGTNDFRLILTPNGTDNDVKIQFNGAEHTFGLLGIRYQHLAFTIDSSGNNRTVTAYKNGVPFGTPRTFTGVTGNWSETGQNWMLGARPSGGGQTDYYGGLIDEVAMYDSTLSQTKILEHFQNSRNPQERGLRVYFALDEGSGNRLNNSGSLLTGSGMGFGTTWTPQAPNQMTEPHIFAPKTRQVTLNPSVTSVDQVDFTDRSLVAVSGFARYANTDCFAEGVEILVNGESFSPKILTDSTGRFVIDFEPGTTATLTPVYKDHQFTPAFWEVTNVVSPISGILFSDVTTRKIKGQIAGGLCRKPIISGPIEDCRITVRTKDGCFEWVQVISNPDGNFEFNPLPPLEVTIAITKHNNPVIYQDFQTQGGREIDLTLKDSTGVDFIYIAPPSVGVEGLENYYTACKDPMHPLLPLPDIDGNPLVILEEGEMAQLDINVYEQYGVGQDPADRCLLDSAILSISNTFDYLYNFLEPKVDTMRNKKYDYNFVAAYPNPDPPYLKLMQITADVNGRKGTFVRRALITGVIKGEKKFTTVSPMMPSFVLRDPPGDGSYAYIEKGETFCNTMKTSNGGGAGPFFTLNTAAGAGTYITVPFFPSFEVKSIFGVTSEFDLRIIKTSTTSMEYCLTANERISTDDGELIVGSKSSFDGGQKIVAGNDVYVGTAFNFIISDSKFLAFDDMTCNVKLNTVTSVEPDSFATTYMYSEWNIENNVIRYLDSLILDGKDANGINSTSKQRWLDFIKMNHDAKAKATFKKNISWDAGAQYEYSESRDTSTVVDDELVEKFEGTLGLLQIADGEGAGLKVVYELKVGAKFEGTFSQATGTIEKRGVKVGYVFKDNDPGDTWTVDIKDDPLFKTPTFTIVAGQTSCPWEVGTAHREGMKLVSLDGNTRLNVPSNGEAAFRFQLQNNSQTGETFTYAFTTGPESNTKGAKIFLNGGPLDKYVYYAIPWGTTIEAVVTVERGPTEYLYENFEIVLLSACHDQRCNTLGVLPDLEPFLYSAVYLTVEFEEPCSEVDISEPQNGWVIKPDPNNMLTQNLLPITVSGYNKKDDDLLGIRLQYRPENGDGAWINITNQNMDNYIPKADLGDVFEVYNWDTDGTPPLADGPYEIRAITVCDGAPTDNPGISHVIKGKIDRKPPSLVGTPEPSDGVYNVGDEISFTFNKPINCSPLKLIEADLTQPNNVGLFNTTTGKPISVQISCYENKITMVPRDQNKFIENLVLRAELNGIEDLTGNTLIHTDWEFVVDRNELAWLTDSMGLTKYEGEYKVGTAAIHNRGGYPVPFKITGAPNWVRVVPSAGTLVANQILPITFEVDSSLAFGRWSDTIVLHTETGQNPFFMGGDEPLPIGVRVVCRPPDWKVNPSLFENSMNMVLKLNVEGQFSIDEEDIVAAFINGELRGRANVRYVPQLNAYLAYLNVYGNPADQLAPVRLEIWDASACLRYGSVVETFTFQPDNVIGIPDDPQVVHTSGLVLREVPLGYGWNWISFNLAFPDNSINPALASLNHPQNDLMKSQGPFSTYSSGSWLGSLTNLNNTTMYIYRADLPDTLKMLGDLIDPATTPIALVTGWNWIGYVPSYSLSVNAALSSLPSQKGDLVKSQTEFAQYISPAFGWVGSLQYMQPPNGYQIKVATPGTLTYPPLTQITNPLENRGGKNERPTALWTVNPAQYEHSMTLIGMLKVNGQNATTATMELGVFAGNEVRGSAVAVYIAPLNAYQFFLTTYANVGGEQLKFKLFDSATGTVQDLTEIMWFVSDMHQGSVEAPMPFTLKTSGLADFAVEQSFEVQPNPFSTETLLRFALTHAQEVTISISDLNGREVARLRSQARAGINTATWDGTSDAGLRLGSGVYFVRLNTEEGSVARKVMIQR